MLLECTAEERDELLSVPEVREKRIEEALSVLREAGDPRVAPLTIDVSCATTSGSAQAMRMSPRVSANPYASSNILSPPAAALAAVSLAAR
jgi:hypothetical protein|eukprot:Transcript_14219.p3 GENE.Transcript_14219~~Transcript_14219.p3  ORF type:complete len:91 (+),score=31.95 Transcript_14219:433-705(+)